MSPKSRIPTAADSFNHQKKDKVLDGVALLNEKPLAQHPLSDSEYFVGYTLLGACSDEKYLLSDAVRKAAQQSGLQIRSMLDVGSGSGRLFDIAGRRKLDYLEFVEPSPLLHEISLATAPRAANRFLGKLASIEELLPLRQTKFDLIMLSHVLYHIHRKDWRDLIDELRSTLTESGLICVVLWNRTSEAYQITRARSNKQDFALAEQFVEEFSSIRSNAFRKVDIRPNIELHTDAAASALWRFMLKCHPEALPFARHRVASGGPLKINNNQTVMFLQRT